METKKGVVIPDDLAEALRGAGGMLAAFERMRPSCQRKYADMVSSAAQPPLRVRRIDSVLAQVAKWAARHGD